MIGNIVAGLQDSGVPLVFGDFESIATAVGTGSSNTVSFTSIPSTFQHLQIRIMAKSTTATTDVDSYIQFNGVTSSGNYTHYHQLYGDGSSATSNADTAVTDRSIGIYTTGTSRTDIYGAAVIDILDYNSTNKNKTLRMLTGYDANGAGYVFLRSSLFRPSTIAAITSIDLIINSGNWDSNSIFALYGIRG